jgi:hypothetical protein
MARDPVISLTWLAVLKFYYTLQLERDMVASASLALSVLVAVCVYIWVVHLDTATDQVPALCALDSGARGTRCDHREASP